jgi:hypothetical protein
MRRLLTGCYGLGFLLLALAWLTGVGLALCWLASHLDVSGLGTPPTDVFVSEAHALIGGLFWFGLLVWGLILVPYGMMVLLFGPLIWLERCLWPAPLAQAPPPPTVPLGVPSPRLPAWDPHLWTYKTGYETFTGGWMVCEQCAHCHQERWRRD